MKILVVDEQPNSVEIFWSNLEELFDHEIVLIDNADQAIYIIDHYLSDYDVLVFDQLMPRGDILGKQFQYEDKKSTGECLYLHVRNISKVDIPVIIFTQFDNTDWLLDIIRNPIDKLHHCNKKIDESIFNEMLLNLCGG